MLEPIWEYKVNAEKDWKAAADVNMEYASQLHKALNEHFLLKEIEEVLQGHQVGYMEKLFQLIQHPEYEKVRNYEWKLFVLKQMYDICQTELEEEKTPILCRITSLEEAEGIYDATYFLLKRIEMGLPEEYQIELTDWVREKDLSAAFLLTVIEQGRFLYKISIAERTAELLVGIGWLKEAGRVLAWARQKGGIRE